MLGPSRRSAQTKLACLLIVTVDRASLGAGELHRLGDDGGEDGLEIKRRVHRLRHFTERAQFPNRLGELARACLHFVKQSHVLNRNHRLVGEGLSESICFSEKGRTSVRRIESDPMATPSRSKGTERMVRWSIRCAIPCPSGTQSARPEGRARGSACDRRRSDRQSRLW